MDKERIQQRLKEFQQLPDLEWKRRHEETRVQLRKQQRSKRFAQNASSTHIDLVSPALRRSLPRLRETHVSVQEKCALVLNFMRENNPPDLVFEAVQLLRKKCSDEDVMRKQDLESFLVKEGVADVLYRLLADRHSGILSEALWCLTNLTAGSHETTMAVAKRETLTLVVELISHQEVEVMVNSLYAVGNIASDCIELNAYLHSIGALDKVMEVLFRYKQFSRPTLKMILWTLGRLFITDVGIRKDIIYDSSRLIIEMMQDRNEEIVELGLFVLGKLSLIQSGAQAVFQLRALPLIQEFTRDSNTTVSHNALLILGNILSICNDYDTEKLLESGLISTLRTRTSVPLYRQTIMWMLSNLLAGTRKHKVAVLQDSLLHYILDSVETGDEQVSLHVSYCFYNALRGEAGREIAALLAESGALTSLKRLIYSTDNPEILLNCLKSVDCILLSGLDKSSGRNPLTVQWEEVGGLSLLEDLQKHPSEEIYAEAVRLMSAHYGLLETEKECQDLPPPVHFVFS